MYRNQLGDCRSAIAHYNRAIVFGRTTELDAKLLLSRASCALEVGNLELVRSDLRWLELKPSHVVRSQQVQALKRKLAETTQDKTNKSERK